MIHYYSKSRLNLLPIQLILSLVQKRNLLRLTTTEDYK